MKLKEKLGLDKFKLNYTTLINLGPLLALVFLFILATLINPAFLSAGNLRNVFARTAFIGIIAVGATFVIVAGGIDLSVGSMAAFISGVMIISMNAAVDQFGVGLPIVLIGMAVSLGLGFAAGAFNGLFVTKGKIEPFIITLGTMGIFRSLVTYLADGGTLSLNFGVRTTYRPVYYGVFLGIPVPVIVLAIIAIIATIILNKTSFGRYCTAIGSSYEVAKYSAINVTKIRTMTFILQGICVAIATILYVPRLGAASSTTGLMWELEAIASVIIGGTALKGGYGRIWGTIVGAIILTLIGNILNLTGMVSPYLNG
ncbi:MAG: ABC transporter permease, partial [Thermodesulfobacteriota bacterium]